MISSIFQGDEVGNGLDISANKIDNDLNISADEVDDGMGICGWVLTALSWCLVIITMPVSLCVCFKVIVVFVFVMLYQWNTVHFNYKGYRD